MREIKHLSIHQWLRSAIPDSQQRSSPIGFLFLKLPPPPCAVLLVAILIVVIVVVTVVAISVNMAMIAKLLMALLLLLLSSDYIHNPAYIWGAPALLPSHPQKPSLPWSA